MKLCEEIDLNHLIFEGDCLIVIKGILSEKDVSNEIGSIMHYLNMMLRKRPTSLKLEFVRQESNKVAHLLAQKTLILKEEFIWLEECLMDVMPLVYFVKHL